MVRLMVVLLLLALPARAQNAVNPDDLVLTVTLENVGTEPFQNEMVLLEIHGVYRRHITLEKLEQPDLTAFNWMQLGEDHWYESELDGLTVKNFRRRMALFPDKDGRLEIGPFTHHLTLLDDDNKWFEYDIQSLPIRLDVQPVPPVDDWWFPVRELEISDQWSNPPDQLKAGDGVLRIITLKSVGVSPEMVPPMPKLTSPSAHIFEHPLKQLVELSPKGPVTYTFWRWTIKPHNPPSAILEPIRFSYYDTEQRKMQDVTISAQRIAFDASEFAQNEDMKTAIYPSVLRPFTLAGIAILSLFLGGVCLAERGRSFSLDRYREWYADFRLKRSLSIGAKNKNYQILRRAAHDLDRNRPHNQERNSLLTGLDRAIFSSSSAVFDFKAFVKDFTRTLGPKPPK